MRYSEKNIVGAKRSYCHYRKKM